MLRSAGLALVCVLTLAACGDDDGDGGGDGDGTTADAGPMTWTPPAHCTDGPLDAPIAGCSPTAAPSSGDLAQDCVDRINQFRAECQCLPPLARWEDGEECADEQAEYDSTREPHAGFRDGICDSGFNSGKVARLRWLLRCALIWSVILS